MRILIACEESQRVCVEFRANGHEAYSCDIVMTSGNNPEWHIWADCTPLLNGKCRFRTCDGQLHYVDRWDMIIAFPPCTYLTKAGACNLYKNGVRDEERYAAAIRAVEFFYRIYNADCNKIAIENPVPIKEFGLPEPDQVIQPYYFGEPVSKKTYLWLKGLPYLCPTNVVQPEYTFETYPPFKNCNGKYRSKARSKTFWELQWQWRSHGEVARLTICVSFKVALRSRLAAPSSGVVFLGFATWVTICVVFRGFYEKIEEYSIRPFGLLGIFAY